MRQFVFFLQLPRRVLFIEMRFTVGGDAEHYTVGASAAVLLLLIIVLPFTTLLGSTLAFFFFFPAHVRTATARYRALTTVRGDTALLAAFNSAVEISPFDVVPLGANSLSTQLWAYTSFLQLALVLHYPSGAVEIAVTC